MAQSLSGLLILLVAIVAANAPFLTQRLLGVVRLRTDKSAALRFLELAAYYLLTLGLAILIETRFGPRYPQRWEFYGITACLFLVLGYPGFVWRYLRGSGSRPHAADPIAPDSIAPGTDVSAPAGPEPNAASAPGVPIVPDRRPPLSGKRP